MNRLSAFVQFVLVILMSLIAAAGAGLALRTFLWSAGI